MPFRRYFLLLISLGPTSLVPVAKMQLQQLEAEQCNHEESIFDASKAAALLFKNLHIPRESRPISPTIKKLMGKSSLYRRISVDEVSEYVAHNPLWLRLYPILRAVHLMMESKKRTVLLLVLQEDGVEVVLKAYSAQHAAESKEQITAEIDGAKLFSGHPLLATVLSTCYDAAGNFCSVSPYAGCSLYNLLQHPLWMAATTLGERLKFFQHVAVHCLTAHAVMQGKPESAYIYRDTKPENIAIELSSGHVKVLDLGLAIHASKSNYFEAVTFGYFTPEIVDAGPNLHENFFDYEKCRLCTNATMDVFLLSFVGLEVVLGLPAELRNTSYDLNSQNPKAGCELLDLMAAHSAADYTGIINRLPQHYSEARDFFARTLCLDPEQRPTPAEALKLPWLAGSVAAVQQSVAAAMPDYQQRNQLVLDLLSGVEGAFLAPVQQQQEEGAADTTRARSPTSSSVDEPETPTLCSSSVSSSQCSSAVPVPSSAAAKDLLQQEQVLEMENKEAQPAAEGEASLVQAY